ncbi:MFS transporter [Kribbella deserti]|uniref:MFS transporter n=1 Tax=Kribbella deserti TaxID=1926257 RepID=A0ABV6QMU1_9ACTN
MTVEARRRGILRDPDFRRFWTADLLSQLGIRLGMLAVPLLAVLELTASAFEVSLLRAFETAAWLLIGLFAGAWMDRIRCKPVMITADLARAAFFASVPVAAAFGVLTLAQLYVVLFLAGVMTVLFDVAHSTYLPRLVDREDLVAGNAKLAANHSVGAVAGQGIGGYLVQWFTAPAAIGLNALGFVWSALWLRSIRAVEARPVPAEQPHLRREIGAGLRFVVRHPLLRPIALTSATTMLFQAANNAIIVVFLVRELGLSAGKIGLLGMIGLLGALVAAAATERISRRVGHARAMWITALTNGLGFCWSRWRSRDGGSASTYWAL